MSFIDQAVTNGSGSRATPTPLPEDMAGPTDPESRTRVNWLFAGVVLGAGSWMLVLGVIFAVLGQWIAAAALLVGLCLCLLGIWGAERRLRAEQPDSGHGRHRAVAGAGRSGRSVLG
jgi:hypothetical protein